jgi:HEAT repeat protein
MDSDDMLMQKLLEKLSSVDALERDEAISGLAEMGDIQAVAALVTALEDPDKGIRESAAQAIILRKSPDAAVFLCEYLASPQISSRNLASELLTSLGELAVPALTDKVFDPDRDVRKFAVDILGTIKDCSVFDVICKALDDESANVVCSAAEALGSIGDQRAANSLIEAYDRSSDARPQIIEALGRIGDRRALPLLVRALDADDPVLVFTAVEAMGNLKAREAEPYLRKLLKKDDGAFQEAVVNALIKVARASDRKIMDDLPTAQLQTCLIGAVRSGDHDTKLFALDELRSWNVPIAIDLLLDALNDKDEDVAAKAKEILTVTAMSATEKISEALHTASPAMACNLLDMIATTGNSRFVRDVVELINCSDENIREHVASALGKIGDEHVVAAMGRLTSDPIGHVRSAVYKALGWIGGEQAVELLFNGLDDEYPDVRQAALGGLILNASFDVIKRLTEDLHHETPSRQIMAAQALGWIGEAGVVEPLVSALNHPEWEVRKSAVESLGRIADPSALEHIRILLNDEEPRVRKSAIDAIIVIAGADAYQAVSYLLTDEDIWVRFHAINALGRIGNPAAIESLLSFLSDENDILRVATAKALSGFHDKRVLPFLQGSTRDRNPDVVNAVNDAIAQLEALV